ncbi:GNAT family N-acetyltransferase [Alkalibacterium pelagium]|uniref:Diamine N-acetyltransferase n=1 Tax=Alkalibacterium pelagium TaxID=426702 RepID=A0A1H7NKY6_9LACT|nr:GNAT family N-acetyltransferase [Alkalibacterium pelagium]GEN51460.1 spermine/spermidine acetyltransferase [Alkalibacterium pelagium]SEL23658.1 diamine N-acetyltransferase [Alkalibacterium pelagium]
MISLVKVSEANWREVTELKVSDEQTVHIESNAQSLLEAAYDTSLDWHPYGIYSGDDLVGFAMIGAYNLEERYIWLDRLMLSYDVQGEGLGTEVMRVIVEYISENWDVSEIVLSVTPDNHVAIGFYEKVGFQWLDKTDPANGEQLMSMKI